MVDISRILCPVDFSDIARRALDHAVSLARRRGATVVALHVAPLAGALPLVPAPVHPEAALPDPNARRSMLERLEQAVGPARQEGTRVETVVRQGDPVHAILRESELLPIDLVVMGTHGMGGFKHLVLGSVAEKVLGKAPCPVLTVGPSPDGGRDAARRVRYDRILCPIDFSEPSISALEYALSLAESPASRLTLVHIQEQMLFSVLPFERALQEGDSIRVSLYRIQEHLTRLLPEGASELCSPRAVARRGRPYKEILHLAREEHSDVIVLGVHGRPFVERLRLGSVTSHMVRSAPCPVLTVRATTRTPVPVGPGKGEARRAT
jgi:nucleotide-binding universal stress UspA family protein